LKQVDKTAKIWEPVVIVDDAMHNVVIGPRCRIGQFAFIAARKLVMEEGAEICATAVLSGGGDVYMGKYTCVDFGAKLINCTFTTAGEYMNDAIMEDDPSRVDVIRGSITLKEGAVICSNAIVCVSKRCKDIVIGEHSVVGAGSYVDCSVPPNTIIYPTRIHRGYEKFAGFTQKRRRPDK
jgi:acetyltransferase-like isoleucine patch superfamily enzyme